jgi:hypothetical protein
MLTEFSILVQKRCCEHNHGLLVPIKGRGFLHELHDYHLGRYKVIIAV